MRLVVYDETGRIGHGWTLFDNDFGTAVPVLIDDNITVHGAGLPLPEGMYQLHILSHEIALYNDTIQ
jgi:hypothetical protein